MAKTSIISLVLFLTIVSGCTRDKLTDFTYMFSIESISNFRVEMQLNPDTSYTVRRDNYFFDKYEGVFRPQIIEGVLSTEEFIHFQELISDSNLKKMKNSYGFEESNLGEEVIYTLQLTHKGETKYISIKLNSKQTFDPSFIELIKSSSDFIDQTVTDDEPIIGK